MFKKKYVLTTSKLHIILSSYNLAPNVRDGGIELLTARLCEGLVAWRAGVIFYSLSGFNILNVEHTKTPEEPSIPRNESGKPIPEERLKSVCPTSQGTLKSSHIILVNHPDYYRHIERLLGIFNWLKVHTNELAHWVDVGVQKNIIYPLSTWQSHLLNLGRY